MATRSSNALNHIEKVILAYSRTVSGTLSIISSILILNKIYRCCYKKRLLSLNNNNNNNNATGNTNAGGNPLPRIHQLSTVPELNNTNQSHSNDNTSPTTLTRQLDDNVQPLPQIFTDETQTNNNNHNHNRLLLVVEDDGYTPLPSQQEIIRPSTNIVTTSHSAAATPTSRAEVIAVPTTTPYQLSLVSLLSYTTVYQRLLIGTSVIDLFHSFWAALSTLPVPASSGAVGAYGTVTTCSIQGFFVQFSAATPIYFAALTFYFMSKVCYHTTDALLSQRYEIYFHLLPIIVAFGGGIIGVSLKVFNPIALPELGCWVAPYPVGCAVQQNCTRGYKIGEYSDWYAWCFAFMWFFLSFIVVVINTTMIYSTIYYRERYGPSHTRARFRPPQSHTELPSSYGSSTVMSNISSQNKDHYPTNGNNEGSIIGQSDYADENANEYANANEIQPIDHHQRPHPTNNDNVDRGIPPLNSRTESNTSNTRTIEQNSSNHESSAITIPTGTRTQRRRSQQQQPQTPGMAPGQQRQPQLRTSVRTSRIAAVQCVLYVSTALFTTIWSVMPWIGKKLMVTSKWRFFFAFMFNIFNPMQGFLTLIIFIRLQYLRLRVSEPNWSRIQCIRFCLFSPDAK